MVMKAKLCKPSFFYGRDLREWNVPADVLAVLLKDRSTGGNVIWATDDYAERGKGFGFFDEIRADLITDREDPVIRPRVDKPRELQKNRIVKRAEVFTPSWVCNKMQNVFDAEYFECGKSPFNDENEEERTWVSTYGKKRIKFPRNRTWREYVTQPMLEVTCGEAPFLASRYDATTGVMIAVPDRIGILDRKLRIVTENVGSKDAKKWLECAMQAVQGTYGFEWQGDNIVLARENVLATVVETFNYVFFREHSTELSHILKDVAPAPFGHSCLLELAEVISWNMWQMDGLKFVVPMSCERVCEQSAETDLLGERIVTVCPGCRKMKDPIAVAQKHVGIRAKIILDWQSRTTHEFVELLEWGKRVHGKA